MNRNRKKVNRPAKIVFLILASKNEINIIDEQCQRETWASKNLPEVESIWLNGDENISSTFYSIIERRLVVPIKDCNENILEKTVMGIRWLLNNRDFDILVRTNVSSYFAPKMLKVNKWFMSDKPTVGGFLDVAKSRNIVKKDQIFFSGSGIFLNREAAKLLCEIDVSEFSGIPDDVAISIYLSELEVRTLFIRRCNIHNTGLFRAIPYQRLKSSIHPKVTSERMELVHRFFVSNTFIDRIKARLILYLYESRYIIKYEERRDEFIANTLPNFKNVIRNFLYKRKHHAKIR